MTACVYASSLIIWSTADQNTDLQQFLCFDYILGAICKSVHEETAAYKQAVREVDSDIQAVILWFINKLCDL